MCSHGLLFILSRLQPFVEPVKERTLPENTVLRFEYPVIFIRENQQLCRYPSQLGRIECRHTLGSQDAVILFSMDTENRRIPLVDKEVR